MLRQVASSAAVLWVTHDDQQPTRVGGKVLVLPSGGSMIWQARMQVPVVPAPATKPHMQQCYGD